MNKFLIIGTGGVGGSIAGFLALAGKDVTCIARGKHLKAIREKGLHLKSDLKGEHYLSVKACTAEEYNEQADVIFVCVKGYSINSIQDVLERASHQDTLVIPILNVYGTGPRIGRLVPRVTVLDGCIYIVGFVSGTGEITQMGKIFRLVFGARPEQEIAPGRLEAVANALRDAGIMVFHLRHGMHRSLSQCPDGRIAASRRRTRHLHRPVSRKQRNGTSHGHHIPRRPDRIQPENH